MSWKLLSSYLDYVQQLRMLLSDPLYRDNTPLRGNGDPILLIPGFLAGDWSLQVMASWLTKQGYHIHDSGVTWNVQCPLRTGELLQQCLDSLANQHGRPLTVIGHSLGGVLARFLGANFPHYVHRVIALGSPIDDSMRIHPIVPLTFRMLQNVRGAIGKERPPCAKNIHCACRFTQTTFAPLPPSVQFTAIYSRQDEIVDWRACVDPDGDNREVSGLHLGLVVNRDVYQTLAEVLATQKEPCALSSTNTILAA